MATSFVPHQLSTDDNCSILNEEFDKCMFVTTDENGDRTFRPFVCSVCNMFVKPSNKQTVTWKKLHGCQELLQPRTLRPLPTAILDYYVCHGKYEIPGGKDTIDLSTMMLSPSTQIATRQRKAGKNGKSTETPIGIVVCKFCHTSLSNSYVPKFAICNGFYLGAPPPELTELNQVELAFLSPVKAYGYCFAYTGSKQCSMQLKGTLSFYKIDPSSIVKTVAKFDALELSDNIVVLLHGKMTREQRKRAKEKTALRPNKVLKAMQWLCENHETYKTLEVDMEALKRKMEKPILIDESQTYDTKEYQEVFLSMDKSGPPANSRSNIETTDQFQIFFPDKTLNSTQGGHVDKQSFEEFLKTSKLSDFSFHMHTDFQKFIVPDYKDDNLVNACLLQFPYGRGGINELYWDKEESFRQRVDVRDYAKALSRNSTPTCQLELFQLILYNLEQKQRMFQNACFQVRNPLRAGHIAHELTTQQVRKALGRKLRGHNAPDPQSASGHVYLDSVEAVAGSVAHSNKSTKAAKREAEAMSHHFGMPSYFLTVTPDDNHNFLVQVYSGNIIDEPGKPVSDLTDEELTERYNRRTLLRIKYPGIGAYVFEILMDIVIKKVIGWGNNEDNIGMLGKCLAYSESVEEQGRLSLHAHFQIWIERIGLLQRHLFGNRAADKARAARQLARHADEHTSTKFLFHEDDMPETVLKQKEVFEHECTVPWQHRSPLVLADDQTLRNLRSRYARSCPESNPFAICPHCLKLWTHEQIVHQYLTKGIGVPSLSAWPEDSVHRLKSMCIEHQREGHKNTRPPRWLVEAAFNVHRHRVGSCYKKRKHNVLDSDCRMKYPKRPRTKTVINEILDDAKVQWYSIDGSFSIISCLELLVQRAHWDAFQNASCDYISHSKFQCNTNIQLLLPGILSSYVFKYAFKDTHDDDSKGYTRLINNVSRLMADVSKDNALVFSKATSRLLSSAIVHQSSNLVGAPMAAYLTRNDTRFKFSHQFVWCPIRDLRTLLEGGSIDYQLTVVSGKARYNCSALNYLCRPVGLEGVKVFSFYSEYETAYRKRDDDNDSDFVENGGFVHPSLNSRSKKYSITMKKMKQAKLIKIFQYDFPDTASFQGNITDPSVTINDAMERYSSLALILFVPFRHAEDLQVDGSYAKMFRKLLRDRYFTEKELEFLQNIQNAKANNWRYISHEDELQRITEPFDVRTHQAENPDDDEDEDQESPAAHTEMCTHQELKDLLLHLTGDADGVTNTSNACSEHPSSLNLIQMRMKGTNQAGFTFLPTPTQAQNQSKLVRFSGSSNSVESTGEGNQSSSYGENEAVTQQALVTTLFLQTKKRRVENVLGFAEDDTYGLNATGSAGNIVEWGRAARLDKEQRAAFETITSHFILSFYREARKTLEVHDRTHRASFLHNYKDLCKLTRTDYDRNPQLIGLLHGPAGSGKSRVLKLLMQYAEEFCANLPDYEFTDRTILLTAYSGVAATLLKGETFHSALYINRQQELTGEQIDRFVDTRLVIIDEISFASISDLRKLHVNLESLKQTFRGLYGGVDILFSGDFRQLDPVKGTPLYQEPGHAFFEDAVNAYMELNGKHRFKDDPEYGDLLEHIREGTVTKEEIAMINSRKVEAGDSLPPDTPIAVQLNRDRDVKNTAIFHHQLLEDIRTTGTNTQSVMLFAGDVHIKQGGTFLPCMSPFMAMYQHCGEDDLDYGDHSSRLDPVLKLRVGSRVMVTRNINVTAGIANGTVATVEEIVLKSGSQGFNVDLADGVSVLGVYSDQVDYIKLKHTDPSIQPEFFQMIPEASTIHPLIPLHPSNGIQVGGKKNREKWTVRVVHFPLVLCWATTVHKLQGQSLDRLFIHSWKLSSDWIYVALSRLRTRAGLFINKCLAFNPDSFKPHKNYLRMLSYFRTHKVRPDLDDDDIQQILSRSYLPRN